MRTLFHFGIAGALTLCSGCGVLERAACGEPCEGGWEPAAGSAEAFSLGGWESDASRVSTPSDCQSEYGGDVAWIDIATDGATSPDRQAWITDRLMPELLARDLPLPTRTVGSCFDSEDVALDYSLALSDWSAADPLVDVVLELAEADDIALAVSVGVEAQPISCPDDACGF